MSNALEGRVRLTALLTRLSLLGLIVLFSLWTFWISPPKGAHPLSIWVFQVTPLACFLPGVFQGKPRVHIWLCFVILLYFCGGVIAAMTPGLRGYGLIQGGLALALFTSAMFYARWKSRWERQRR